MRRLNCIVVFDQDKNNVLFCKRMKEPYKDLYNFPGGKVESGENSLSAAYRELEEETGIGEDKIRLHHFMDLTYYEQEFILEMYVGGLIDTVELIEEINPLKWLPLTENFADETKYAGEKNIAHIINVALKYPLEKKKPQPMR